MYLLMLILLFFGCSCWKQSYCRNEVRVFDSGSVVGGNPVKWLCAVDDCYERNSGRILR